VNPKLIERINRRFRNIDDALERVGRFDWKNFAIAEVLKPRLEAVPRCPRGRWLRPLVRDCGDGFRLLFLP